MLYIIGLGLNEEGFSFEAYNAVKNSRRVYLESYTVEFPFSKEELEVKLEKKIKELKREDVESDRLVKEAKEDNVALLVYGAPLMATTHISLIEECRKRKVPYRVIQGASILDAVAETGLSIYKFGKIASLPKFEASSFIDIVKVNLDMNAHSLILIDIGLSFSDALDLFEKAAKGRKLVLGKMLVCSLLGTKRSKIYYKKFMEFKKEKETLKIKAPFCFVIPAEELNIVEGEIFGRF